MPDLRPLKENKLPEAADMKQDPDLTILRARDDFQKLVAELEANK